MPRDLNRMEFERILIGHGFRKHSTPSGCWSLPAPLSSVSVLELNGGTLRARLAYFLCVWERETGKLDERDRT